MQSPVIKKISSSLPPWHAFLKLFSAKSVGFFLDSHASVPPDQRYSYLGAEPFLELRAGSRSVTIEGSSNGTYAPDQLWTQLRRLLARYRRPYRKNRGYFTGGAVGFLSYDAVFPERGDSRPGKPETAGIPRAWFGFYRNLIVFDHTQGCYYLVAGSRRDARRYFEMWTEVLQTNPDHEYGMIECTAVPENFRPEISREQFQGMVSRAKEYIAAGDIYQANLSQRFCFDYNGNPLRLYQDLRQINPSPFASYLRSGPLHVISCSPERLVKKSGTRCETRPIAGTRPRRAEGKDLPAMEKELMGSEKERAEHLMLVDLERNDLGRVCDYRSVRVEEMMAIERYSHVIHIVSKISGQLSRGRDGVDLIRAMFPGGTITGCPKVRCMEIIDELEPSRRGLYTGSAGYLGFDGDMDLNIVIRTIVLNGTKGMFQVGAGIVHDSDPESEYRETLHKGEALMEALAGTVTGAV